MLPEARDRLGRPWRRPRAPPWSRARSAPRASSTTLRDAPASTPRPAPPTVARLRRGCVDLLDALRDRLRRARQLLDAGGVGLDGGRVLLGRRRDLLDRGGDLGHGARRCRARPLRAPWRARRRLRIERASSSVVAEVSSTAVAISVASAATSLERACRRRRPRRSRSAMRSPTPARRSRAGRCPWTSARWSAPTSSIADGVGLAARGHVGHAGARLGGRRQQLLGRGGQILGVGASRP